MVARGAPGRSLTDHVDGERARPGVFAQGGSRAHCRGGGGRPDDVWCERITAQAGGLAAVAIRLQARRSNPRDGRGRGTRYLRTMPRPRTEKRRFPFESAKGGAGRGGCGAPAVAGGSRVGQWALGIGLLRRVVVAVGPTEGRWGLLETTGRPDSTGTGPGPFWSGGTARNLGNGGMRLGGTRESWFGGVHPGEGSGRAKGPEAALLRYWRGMAGNGVVLGSGGLPPPNLFKPGFHAGPDVACGGKGEIPSAFWGSVAGGSCYERRNPKRPKPNIAGVGRVFAW